jgi:hypothetical protein
MRQEGQIMMMVEVSLEKTSCSTHKIFVDDTVSLSLLREFRQEGGKLQLLETLFLVAS